MRLFLIVGTSLVVYPAASLIDFVPRRTKRYLVDPSDIKLGERPEIVHIKERATTGVPKLVATLLSEGS